MKTVRGVGFGLAVLAMSGRGGAAQTHPSQPPEAVRASASPAEASVRAVSIARGYLGDVINSDQGSPTVVLKTANAHPCPLLSDSDRYWEVAFGPVNFCFGRAAGARPAVREVVVLVAHDTLEVIRAEITDPTKRDKATPEPTGRSARIQLRTTGPERWLRAASTASVSLGGALDAIATRGFPPADGAARVIVNQLLWSDGLSVPGFVSPTYEPRVVWSIDLRGSQIVRQPEGVPDEAVNHLRHVIDGHTGKWLVATSTPQPGEVEEPPPEDPSFSPAKLLEGYKPLKRPEPKPQDPAPAGGQR